MPAPPYIPLYIADYHADTTHLSRGEHGAYLLLLMAMWRAGGRLPSDDARLAKLAMCTPEEWTELRPTIIEFFKRRGGHLTHKRIALEMAKYENRIVRAKRGGKASAAKKANENSEKSQDLVGAKFNQPEPEPEPEPDISVDKSTASLAVVSADHDQTAWTIAVLLLTDRAGLSEVEARKFFGKLLSANGLMAREMVPSLASAEINGTQDPKGYLAKAAQLLAKRREPKAQKRVGFV